MKDLRNIKDVVSAYIQAQPVLVENTGVTISLLCDEHIPEVITLYKRAYERADWFAGNHPNVNDTMFHPSWLMQRQHDRNYTFIVFTGKEGVLGSTALIATKGHISIDETQLDPIKGRKKGVMSTYFRTIIPLLQQNNVPLSTEFVLTPESQSLRRVLLGELGMHPTGMHTDILTSPYNGIRKSEISAVWHPNYDQEPLELIPETRALYNIVAAEIGLEKVRDAKQPTVLFTDTYEEQQAHALYPETQQELVDQGFVAVAYHPREKLLTMARFPQPNLEELAFIEGENIETNIALFNYLKNIRGKNETTR